MLDGLDLPFNPALLYWSRGSFTGTSFFLFRLLLGPEVLDEEEGLLESSEGGLAPLD